MGENHEPYRTDFGLAQPQLVNYFVIFWGGTLNNLNFFFLIKLWKYDYEEKQALIATRLSVLPCICKYPTIYL